MVNLRQIREAFRQFRLYAQDLQAQLDNRAPPQGVATRSLPVRFTRFARKPAELCVLHVQTAVEERKEKQPAETKGSREYALNHLIDGIYCDQRLWRMRASWWATLIPLQAASILAW